MLYGNLKNCTYTQTTMNFNAGVGFFMGLLFTKYEPALITYGWYIYIIGLLLFMVPGLISTYIQMNANLSLESIKLTERPFRTF